MYPCQVSNCNSMGDAFCLGGTGGLIRMGMPGFAEQWGRMKHWNTHKLL